MLKLRLCLTITFVPSPGSTTGFYEEQEFFRDVEWPTCPRIGEAVRFDSDDDYANVVHVFHEFGAGRVDLDCEGISVCLGDCDDTTEEWSDENLVKNLEKAIADMQTRGWTLTST